jgi:hypothetical protein
MANLFEFSATVDAMVRMIEEKYRRYFFLILPDELSTFEGEEVLVIIGPLRFVERVKRTDAGVGVEVPPSVEYLLGPQDGALLSIEVKYPPRNNLSKVAAPPTVIEYTVDDVKVTALKNGHMVITFEDYARYAIVLLHNTEDHLVARKEITGVVLKYYKRDELVNATATPFRTFAEYFRHLAITNDFVLVYRDAILACKGTHCLEYTHNLPPKRVRLNVEEYNAEFMNFLDSLASKQF